MVERMALFMRKRMERVFLTTPVRIERPTAASGWDLVAAAAMASVQHVREDRSRADPPDARSSESRGVRVYLLPEVAADVGCRVQWSGAWWHVARATPVRGEEVYRRLEIEQPQLGTEPLELTFTRRVNGATEVVGTFTVLRTQDQQDPQDSGVVDQFQANTAVGATVTGALTGPGAMSVVRVGDWFTVGSLPGRVLAVDTSYSDHTVVRYRMEQRGVT